ncbi:hypothetical protein [Embleya sp. NPDC005971]|uniref:hypothetical protein n=1 Tax=Embleya sp. NPDC005971 TaxID=3156724 RepID=UPI0033F50B9D
MTTHYTDADLRAEAVRQHREHAANLDHALGAIADKWIGKTIGTSNRYWDLLDWQARETAREALYNLLAYATDLSEWAIAMGADALQPSSHAITLIGGDAPRARIHLAFDPDMPQDARRALTALIGEAVQDALADNT